MIEIRKVRKDEIESSLYIITTAFKTVAKDFALTKENAGTNPAFWTLEKMLEMQNKNIAMFGLFSDGNQTGFIAIEAKDREVYYIERLAVLPEFRHQGYGKKLMNFAVQYVKEQNGKKLEIGIIDENIVLKNWYKSINFKETRTVKFSHLPFTVCYMEKII